MEPTAYGSFYSPLATAIPPGLRYPYPPTPTTTPSARTSMMYFPQPLSVSDSSSKIAATTSSSPPTTPAPPDLSEKPQTDKKLRRQIANSNERRRMQSINSGFHALRLLMPHLQGEKLSKASVLQHAAEHIYRLNQERERLAQQNAALRMMLSKYWVLDSKGDICSGDGKVNKATSPITLIDDEKAAAKELEDIFATRHELDVVKEELERERSLRIRAEAKNRALQEQLASENETEEGSDSEFFSSRKRARTTPEPKSNLDIIVRAIRQIEGDAFSRSTTPTCASHERTALSAFVPITSSKDSSRVSPVTPVYAS